MFAAVAAVLAIALVVSPALGGPSLKKLVKKEVAKQISKATGPQGQSGPAGAAGSARAYGQVQSASNQTCTSTIPCGLDDSKGIAHVFYEGNGLYCIEAPGIDSGDFPIIVSVNWNSTSGPEGDASAMGLDGTGAICPAPDFGVRTMRSSTYVNNVGFDFLIP